MGGNNSTPSNDEGTNANPYRHLIEHVQDAVVEFKLVDSEPVIKDVNQAFIDIFGYRKEEVKNESLNDWIVPEWLTDEAQTFDARTATGDVNYRRVKRETSNGLREFLYRGIPFQNTGTQTDGFAVYTDLTEISRHEHRLQVLNRILRHNLRNNATIILGNTSRLLNELDEQTAETSSIAATIEKAADDLETLTREATDIDTILSYSRTRNSSIDCIPLIHTIVNSYKQQAPGADIQTQLPASMKVHANEYLRLAIDSLVENSIEHHPTESPQLQVRVEDAEADGWVNIHVEDDCPMIPPNEREVVTGEVEITPTHHATGLGLWLVKWTADMFGGELSFDKSHFGGNDVCIRLQKR